MSDSIYDLPELRPLVKQKDPLINMIIYGNNGVGKTTFAATAQAHPSLADCLWIDVEGGLLSVTDNPDLPQGAFTIEIESSNQLKALYWALKRRHSDPDSPFRTIRTVIMDSGTELQTLRLDEVVNAEVEKSEKTRKISKNSKVRDIDEVYQKDFGKNARFLGRWFRAFRDLDVNFILTAYERKNYEEIKVGDTVNRKLVEVTPEFSPKVAQHVRGYMDYVWRLYTVEDENGDLSRRALLQETGVYYAKSRGSLVKRLGNKILDWTDLSAPILPWIYDQISETHNEETNNG